MPINPNVCERKFLPYLYCCHLTLQVLAQFAYGTEKGNHSAYRYPCVYRCGPISSHNNGYRVRHAFCPISCLLMAPFNMLSSRRSSIMLDETWWTLGSTCSVTVTPKIYCHLLFRFEYTLPPRSSNLCRWYWLLDCWFAEISKRMIVTLFLLYTRLSWPVC